MTYNVTLYISRYVVEAQCRRGTDLKLRRDAQCRRGTGVKSQAKKKASQLREAMIDLKMLG